MKTQLFGVVLKTVLPPLLGAAGAMAATLWPAYYAAVCGGQVLPVLGG
ncbi:hypothetical protein [Paracoccus aminovorans]|nr:hypothetical protein [Paracoccus aminovorans]